MVIPLVYFFSVFFPSIHISHSHEEYHKHIALQKHMKLTYIYMITSSSVKMVPFFELQGIILQYYLLEKVL